MRWQGRAVLVGKWAGWNGREQWSSWTGVEERERVMCCSEQLRALAVRALVVRPVYVLRYILRRSVGRSIAEIIWLAFLLCSQLDLVMPQLAQVKQLA